MEKNSDFDTAGTAYPLEKDDTKYPLKSPSNRSYLLTIIGVLLVVAGILAIANWFSIFLLDVNDVQSIYDVNQLKQVNPNITPDQILSFLRVCATIGCILSVFPILGGVLCIKRKMWGVTLACSVIGLLSIGIIFTSSLISLVAVIVLIISRKDFQQPK